MPICCHHLTELGRCKDVGRDSNDGVDKLFINIAKTKYAKILKIMTNLVIIISKTGRYLAGKHSIENICYSVISYICSLIGFLKVSKIIT